jgi:outer membrane lipoprotein SlyB
MKNALFALVALSALLTACASYEPVLDYNDKYQAVGDEQAEKDIDICEKEANEYLKNKKEVEAQVPNDRKIVGSGVLATGLIGSLSGPITEGTTPGNPVEQNTNFTYPKPVPSVSPKVAKQAYMKKCLEDQKYQVLGWE